MASPTLEEDLTRAVGGSHVLTDPELKAPFETDWTGRFTGSARAVVRPATTAEVAACVRACMAHGAAVVPQGGNTGLVGGSVPRPELQRATGRSGSAAEPGTSSAQTVRGPDPGTTGSPDASGGGTGKRGNDQVVLSLVRLSELGPVNRATMQVEAGAGVTLGQLQAAAREAGFEAGLDLSARDTATLGGLVACDAGGAQALRHGTAAARLAGVEAVLADGSVIRRMSGLLKDNAGYDLPALLAGSEGTLGVITGLVWRLTPPSPSRVAAMIGLGSLGEAASLMDELRPALGSLEACDIVTGAALELACGHIGVTTPLGGGFDAYVLLECAGREDPLEELAAALESVPSEQVLIAEGTAERQRLWAPREAMPEAVQAAGIPHKLDIGVPLPRLGELGERLPGVLARLGSEIEVHTFGHLGDGNVHVNLLGLDPDDERADEAVLQLAAELGGTVSAEHGIGVAKARYLGLCRSPEEIDAMHRVKDALDPGGILNPGAVLEPLIRDE